MNNMVLVPDIEKTFGKINFGGKKVEVDNGERGNNRKVLKYAYSLYTEKQRETYVQLPTTANVSRIEHDAEIELVDPTIEWEAGRTQRTANRNSEEFARAVLKAKDIRVKGNK